MKKIALFIFWIHSVFAVHPIREDFASLTRPSSLYTFLSGFALAGVIANTPIDQQIYDFYQKKVQNPVLDPILTPWRILGGPEAILSYISIGSFSMAMRDNYYGQFSRELLTRSARAIMLGSIPLHMVRTITGGCRPKCTRRDSYWSPFTQSHGASGDTFTGAILFITWAKMVESPTLKGVLYTSSILSGVGRINDRYHYPSQVMLGWLMAYLSCDAVAHTKSKNNFTISADRVSFDFEF